MKVDQESYVISRGSEFCNFALSNAGRIRREGRCNYVFGGYNCWHIVSRGSGFVISCGKRYPLEKGDLFSVMEETDIEYGAESDEGWEFYYLRIEGSLAKDLTEKIGFTPASPVVKTPKKEEVLTLFREMLSRMKEREKGPEFYAGNLLLLAQILMEDSSPSLRLSPSSLVEEAQKILQDPFAGNVNINELSSRLHVSRGKLFSAFKEVTGSSPLVFLQQVRLKRICELLEKGELTLAQLARETSFPNEKYLIRFFRKYMGTTPGKYRKGLKTPSR